MNRARVQELRNVIAGIPEEVINLNTYMHGDHTPCGTVACIAGWAEMYPPFKDGIARQSHELFFGLAFDTNLFSFRQPDELGTDKEIALRRLDALLATGTDSTLVEAA